VAWEWSRGREYCYRAGGVPGIAIELGQRGRRNSFPNGEDRLQRGHGKPLHDSGITQNLKTPYVYAWNLNVQHAFNSKITLETAYVGDHGSTSQFGIHDINQPAVGAGWQGVHRFRL